MLQTSNVLQHLHTFSPLICLLLFFFLVLMRPNCCRTQWLPSLFLLLHPFPQITLYWGIEAVDAATHAQGHEERTSRLQNSEKMLQVPASLHEQGLTSGIPNEYLICCSYFYLSVVRKLQRDDWQAALHFLQALLVSPRLVHDEFAPELCQSIMHLYIRHKRQERPASRLSKSATVTDLDEDQANEIMGWMAKEYKAWLLYYQIMSNGEHDPKRLASIDNALPDDKSKYIR